jgi:pyridoxamine 5'-phosphate oxidase
MVNLADLRKNYMQGGLTEEDAGDDPMALFERWFLNAVEAGLPEPNAMTLATATPDGRPSARVVLLKDLEPDGFVFFTNYNSRKGIELEANPFAAIVFLWHELERQVRIEGFVEKVSAEVSDSYFAQRPKLSRLGAWASAQSQVISGRAELEREQAQLMEKYPGDTVPRPEVWGGYRLLPEVIEFWQGRPNRLHDRIRFRATEEDWIKERLSP